MPAHRVYCLAGLWSWLDGRQVTARQIAEHLGCTQNAVNYRIIPAMELHGYYLVQAGTIRTSRRPAAVYSIMRPDENWREK